MDENVLIVDDDLEILNSFRRNFYKMFDLDLASSPEEGLRYIKEKPYQVVVSDYKMPQMDGIRFLTIVKEYSPDTSRIMLTGYADVKTAIDAVNEGQLFRFLTKPCDPDRVGMAIRAGIDYYKLRIAERVLLEQTLSGSISMLVEILSLVNPTAFSRTTRIKKIVSTLVTNLKVKPSWQFELAATLSQIGFVTLPPSILEKVYLQQMLTDQERLMLINHPQVARRLIEKIPRLEPLVPMVSNQQRAYNEFSVVIDSQLPKDAGDLGAQILKVAIDYDNLSVSGRTHSEIIQVMKNRKGTYNPVILAAITEIVEGPASYERRNVNVFELEIGMIADEEIVTLDQTLLLRRGQEITDTVMARLRNIHTHSRIKEPVQVLMPKKA